MMTRPAALLLAVLAPVAAILMACDGRTPPPRIDGTPVTVRFQVEGMHCGGCAEAIVAELRETPGVRGAQCSFDTKVAEVELLPTTNPDDAAAAIRKLGYTVSPAPAPASAADSK
jgi:copper chaperone CopZ